MNLHRITLIVASVLLTGCASNQSPPPNYGSTGGRMDPTRDHGSETHVQAPRSQDLITATDRMAQSIAARPDVNNPESAPRIVVGQIENRTSTIRQQDLQVFLARVRSNLMQSGARAGLEFVREREYIERQRDREFGGKDPDSTSERYRSRADYMLTCEVFDLPSGGTNYFLFSFQLVQLREAATGPDRGSGTIVWENSYEVKYQ